MGIHRTEIDGVPTIWAPADGELRAGLVFRVGRADETLARAGITHLLEHLVLHGVERPDLHFNGATSPLVTTFAVHGGVDEVRDFFTTVCRGLRELPADRLAKEIDVLRTEAAGRGQGFLGPLRTWRYGAGGYGLVGYPEFGLNDLTADDLRAWVDRWFTRGNAALWVTGGPPPEGLLLDLPDGPRCAPPTPHSVLPRTPAYFAADVDGVAYEAILPRRTAATAYALVLDRRLHLRLRRELGISYTTAVSYDSLDAENDALAAFADALTDKHAEVTREFVNILTDLVTGVVTEDELATMRSIAQRNIFDPAVLTGRIHTYAQSILLDKPIRESEEIWDNVRAITAEDVRAIAEQALDTGLAMVPHGQAIGRAGFVAAPTGSDTAIDGTEHRPRNRPDAKQRLIVGPDGVSLVEGLAIATVRYDECAAMLAWPDGARMLFAQDAVNVRIEPQLWEVPARLVADIDARVPAERVAHMRARADDAIPQPPDPSKVATPPAEPRVDAARSRRARVNLYIFLSCLLVLLAMVVLLAATSSPQAAAPAGVVLVWLSLAATARRLRASRTARVRNRSR